MENHINMTADEFFDHWTEWCSMPVTVEEADMLNAVFVNIMKTFEERGSITHHRGIFGPNGTMTFTSPDNRKEIN